jgi:hypothetical protein
MKVALPLAVFLLASAVMSASSAWAALAPQLTRYPYLTDVVGANATVNFGTDRSSISAVVKWGQVGVEACDAHTTAVSRIGITVNGVSEYQWKAALSPLRPDTRYCYRPYLGASSQIDLLGSDPTPQFLSQLPTGSTTPFSFAVLGDWGKARDDGTNPDQANVIQRIADSGARFAVGSGDTAYPAGSQKSYGDLQQTGPDTSAVFGPQGWPVAGRSIPMFNSVGNHAPTSTFLYTWPADVATAAAGGRYQMDTYCCVDGITSNSYVSGWYAFDAGNARFYMLDTAWDAANVGSASQYQVDYDVHWASAAQHDEYSWLANDLAAHPMQLKFAIFHYPLNSDQSSQNSDPYLTGPGHLEALLNQYDVTIAFNGHAHVYQRNSRPPGGVVSYVTGGGGASLSTIGGAGCSPYDAYGIGWSTSSGTGSQCGSAPRPTSASQVYHFLLVTVNGDTVTVAPTDELGRTFDVQTYTFTPGGGGPTTQTYTYTSAADATIDQANPDANYGSDTKLVVDGSPVDDFLLRFDVSTTGCSTITSATLWLTDNANGSAKGGDFYTTTGGWTETGVTWSNAPQRGSLLNSLGAVSSGAAYMVDVTEGVTTLDGEVDFRVGSDNGDGAYYFPRESSASGNRPRLVITCT